VDFHLNETQKMLQDGARRLLSSEFKPEKALDLEARDHGFSIDIWNNMAQLGWNAVALPEAIGGSGLGVIELCILAEEMGRAGVSLPLLISSGLAASCLQALPDSPITTELLKQLATNNHIITAALIDADGRDERSRPTASLQKCGDDSVLTGTKYQVPFASVADNILVSAVTDDGEIAIIVMAAGSDGLTITRHQSLGGAPLFQIAFDNVKII